MEDKGTTHLTSLTHFASRSIKGSRETTSQLSRDMLEMVRDMWRGARGVLYVYSVGGRLLRCRLILVSAADHVCFSYATLCFNVSLYPAKRTMSSTDDQQSSISSLLRDADTLKDQLGGYPNSTGDEYQKKLDLAIKKYQQCKDLVARASLLSLNEPLEDLATSNMRWATTDGVPSSCYSF